MVSATETSESVDRPARWTAPLIDKRYYEVRPALFYRDLIVPTLIFAGAYWWLLRAEG